RERRSGGEHVSQPGVAARAAADPAASAAAAGVPERSPDGVPGISIQTLMMRRVILSVTVAASLGVLVFGQQPFDTLRAAPSEVEGQQTPPTPPQSQQPTSVRIGVEGSGTPKLAIAGVIPLSSDAETVAAAKTINDVLYDDINYEHEFYMFGKDT